MHADLISLWLIPSGGTTQVPQTIVVNVMPNSAHQEVFSYSEALVSHLLWLTTMYMGWLVCSIQDLDVRLNPVTKNEPDYRLFMVHMLVSLRKLGERV